MTTEERLDRIESILTRISESHLELETAQVSQQRAQTRLAETMTAFAEETRERLTNLDGKLSALVEHDQALDGKLLALTGNVEALAEAQHATDGKLNALIDTVDRFIRHRNGSA